MRTFTPEQFSRAIAFLRNRHRVVLSQGSVDGETQVSVDGQALQRADIVRMAETEGWSDRWKPDGSAPQ
ncbi:MAG TPA: hypothetical protein VFU57_10295 [Candidatus Acidoferrales bacterium]|nr:hypothetical protein [Candidatus Acidoferrales bacterium]